MQFSDTALHKHKPTLHNKANWWQVAGFHEWGGHHQAYFHIVLLEYFQISKK